MYPIKNLYIHEQLVEKKTFTINRAFVGTKKFPLLIKTGKTQTEEENIAFREEFKRLQSFNSPFIKKAYSCRRYQAVPAIILEDNGANPVTFYRDMWGCHREVLLLLVELTEAVSVFHSKEMLLHHLSPDTLFYNQQNNQVQIADLSYITFQFQARGKKTTFQLADERSEQNGFLSQSLPLCLDEIKKSLKFNLENDQELLLPKLSPQELLYCSPERIGRFNTPIDQRSDIYVLGVFFYELLTKQKLFTTTDILELAHAHIACKPAPPHDIDENIPRALSALTLKCLAKQPEERFNSCADLLGELHQFLNEFPVYSTPGRYPAVNKKQSVLISRKNPIVGRERQFQQLHHFYSSLPRKKSCFFSVTGTSGSGKTSLVQLSKKNIKTPGLLFLQGSFNQYQATTPYFPFIECLQQLGKKIINGKHWDTLQWKQKILSTLKQNAQVILHVAPGLTALLGKHPCLEPLEPAETKARFENCLKQFIRVCSAKDHPVLLFLDDMQWADKASLDLLQTLLGDATIEYFYIIGSYRSDEAKTNSDLCSFLNWLTQENKHLDQLSLDDLSTSTIEQYLCAFLSGSNHNLYTLAEICKEKTNGNPFYLKQFLQSLYWRNLLFFDNVISSWNFNPDLIREESVSDNVISLILTNFEQLSSQCKNILEYAACLETIFSAKEMQVVSTLSGNELAPLLEEAVQFGFLLHVSSSTSPQKRSEIQPQNHATANELFFLNRYKFSHDQIHQTVYQGIEQEKKQQLHLAIGRRLFSHYSPQLSPVILFSIVGHKNKGMSLLNDKKEKTELAKMNFEAGNRALMTAAYDIAYSYFQQGIALLGSNKWNKPSYSLCLRLNLKAAESCYLKGDYRKMDEYKVLIEANARSLLDKIKIYEIEIQSFISRNQLNLAIEKSLAALALLGESISQNPGKASTFYAYLKTRFLLLGKKPEDLLNLPKMENPYKQAVMRILFRIGTPAYYKGAEFLVLIACKTIQLTLQYGNTPQAAAIGYSAFAIMQCGVIGDIDNGYKNGLVALRLQDRFVPGTTLPACQYIFSNLIQHWKEPLGKSLQPLRQTYENALENGETEQAALALYSYNNRQLLLGKNLYQLASEMAISRSLLGQIGQQIMISRQALTQQLVENLIQPSQIAGQFSGNYYDEQDMVPQHQEAIDNTTLFQLYFMKLFQEYLLGHYPEALSAGREAAKLMNGAISSAFLPHFYFYQSLTLLALFDSQSQLWKSKTEKEIKKNQKKLKKWAFHAPMNYRHLWNLVEAERVKYSRRPHKAASFYEKSIHDARNNGFLPNEALAHELAGKYYLQKNMCSLGKAYIAASYSLFKQWGCRAKNRKMWLEYPQLSNMFSRYTETSASSLKSEISSSLTDLDPVDVQTIIRASQNLSREIHLESYLTSMLKIMIENAGAEKGYLYCKKESDWVPFSQGYVENGVLTVHLFSIDSDDLLPDNIIAGVVKAKKQLIIEDASRDSVYRDEPYIRKNQCKSILCMPFEYQNEITCILFVENNFIVNAFSKEREAVLRHMGSQAAISLRNSLLYRELEKTVKKMELEIENHQQTQQQLVHSEKLAAMGKISASIAHEFGNPVVGIKFLLSDIQKKEAVSPEKQKLLSVAIKECERLQELIKKLRHLYQPTSTTPVPLLLNDIIEDTLLFYGKHLSIKNISLRKKLAADLPLITGIRDQLALVISNLILNAVGAMTEGGVLEISTGVTTAEVYFSIKDTGCGMTAEQQEKIFEPFYSTKQQVEGTGLGLSVSYGIISHHKGTIQVESKVNEGACFTVSFPLPG